MKLRVLAILSLLSGLSVTVLPQAPPYEVLIRNGRVLDLLWRGLASYSVPKIDVQVSAIMRSQANVQATNDPGSNGLAQNATFFQTNAAVLAALGRPIAGGASTVALDLARPGAVFPDRLNTVDMRFTKLLRIGRTRTNVGVDLYNLFNANAGITFNPNFGADGSTWLRPNAILNPRYVRFNATVDF